MTLKTKMSEVEYRTHPAISRSELFKIGDSPEKFKYYKEHPIEPTEAMIFGQLLHKMVLEPEDLLNEFIVAPNVDRRTKVGKKVYSEFISKADGLTVVTQDQFDKAKEMTAALMNNPYAKKLLNGEHEQSYFWQDDLTGEECKCRTDCTVELKKSNLIVDLKTTTNAETSEFIREAIKYGYDLQAGMYTTGVSTVTGKKYDFVFLAIEKEPPYAINILQADAAFMQRGYDLFREYIGIYHSCKETGNWYGYMGNFNYINNLSLPAWMKENKEEK